MQRQAYFEEDDWEESEEGGGGQAMGERMEREWDPDADANETKEGRGERENIGLRQENRREYNTGGLYAA